jgi:transposase InsO family protein
VPWKARTELEERKELIAEWQAGEKNIAELCRRYGISRPTGYKWLKRHAEKGEGGLVELSRAPHYSSQAITDEVREKILTLRHQHPRWGPRKLRACLTRDSGEIRWPAASSIGELLRREGLSRPRRKRNRTVRYSDPLQHAAGANQVWCADFKGWFLCGNGERCDPLTITDAFSRYLLSCRSVAKTDEEHVRAVFETIFRESGMPQAIRTDNGPPFATGAPGGLSRLNIWWMKLGIHHERITPGCPQQNGRHERMHLTLKQETAAPPAGNLRQQQQVFIHFQREYNEKRPHEALQYHTPASLYAVSPRLYPSRLPELRYPSGAIMRAISQDGQFRWINQRVFVSKVLGGEYVGLLPIDEAFYEVYIGTSLLGWFDEAENFFARDPGPPAKREARIEEEGNLQG